MKNIIFYLGMQLNHVIRNQSIDQLMAAANIHI